jgi:CheY-like chemotaxis protein
MKYQTILYIDDDEDDQEIFLSALNMVSPGLNLKSSYNAREALQKLQSKEISPEVIFLDLNMPVMSGQQFLAEIKSSKDLMNIPVILLSTSSQTSTIETMKVLGADGFITKPGNFDQLVQILKSLIS